MLLHFPNNFLVYVGHMIEVQFLNFLNLNRAERNQIKKNCFEGSTSCSRYNYTNQSHNDSASLAEQYIIHKLIRF